jgi:hypothetical protein
MSEDVADGESGNQDSPYDCLNPNPHSFLDLGSWELGVRS